MRRSFELAIVGGLCLVISCLSLWLGAASTYAQGQPPPRPTLTPVPPTRVPVRDSDKSSPTAVPTGRITGTVIDQTTGAPAPNIAVAVGDQTVVTDANGNYGRSGLPAGDYVVALALPAEQGVASQAPIAVTLAADTTVVQHLAFRSPAPLVPTPTSAAAPITLPNTGGADSGAWGPFALGVVLLVLGLVLWSRQVRTAG
jgi:LPXTG-motif cell wall-anchored protein